MFMDILDTIIVSTPKEIELTIHKNFLVPTDPLTIVCDIDETLICPTSLIRYKYNNNDPKSTLRGQIFDINDEEIIVCHKDMPNFLNKFSSLGAKIIFITKRSNMSKDITYKQINALQLQNPIILFTNGCDKAIAFYDYIQSLKGNLVVIDNLVSNLYSFDSAFGFSRYVNRVLLVGVNFV